MKKMFLLLVSSLLVFVGNAEIKVSDVEVFSGYPWTEVVIGYTITGTDADAAFVRLTAADKSANKSYTATTLMGAKLTEGRHIMRWNAVVEGVKLASENVVFSVSVVGWGGVQLWENGPYWAECNVGATKPEEYGYYYWWGDTIGYKRNAANNGWVSVKDGAAFLFTYGNCLTYEKSNSRLQSAGYIDSTGKLRSWYDAAIKHCGAPWRMPTDAEFSALISNCTTTWTTRNGVYGQLVTGKGSYASKSIFLPAAGCGQGSRLAGLDVVGGYWSSTPYSESPYWSAWHLQCGSSGVFVLLDSREYGRSVRPVRGFAQ